MAYRTEGARAPSIHLRNLSYTYPGASDPALSDVTLDIADGEFVLVAGPSGAGKSTLLRCLNGLVPHFTGGTVEGEIVVGDHRPVEEGPHTLSRMVGFVFQDPEAQFVVDRVEDEIAFALENAAVQPTEMRLRVEEVLQLLDLAPLRDRALDTLSGGEKQKVAIAAALALRPRVLALDEPTSQLDPQSAEDVLQALVRLNQDLGLTIVLAEHRLERVLPYVDRLIYLSGPNQSVISGRPRHVLGEIDLNPPLIELAKALGWDPLPLTIKEGRRFASHTPERGAPNAPKRENGRSKRHRSESGQSAGERFAVSDLHFAYNGKPVLQGIDLRIAPGELVALMGRNGSGKTTLLRCVVGLLNPSSGRMKMDGESLIGRETAEISQDVGYLPQEPSDLLFADSVGEELIITLRNHHLLDRPPIAPDDLLARLNLEELKTSYPRDLSAGQRQRVALGAITVTRPRLLLLDEPTRGLDYQAKRELVHLLREWQAEGTSILLVTHDVELVAQAADRVVLLSQGEIIADDAPEVLTSSPLFAPQVARLFPGTDWLTAEDALKGLKG
ncbi:MAG: ATP-binding cassette domain-containing protein [Anaerolineae bacterium]|nr:ATP-binding cassette domain-containing protein [Anaerolineae bacterium]